MNTKPTDGGPAFPYTIPEYKDPYNRHQGDREAVCFAGMSLRDYYAAMPLNEREIELLRSQFGAANPELQIYKLAELRWFNADAMIAERSKNSVDSGGAGG